MSISKGCHIQVENVILSSRNQSPELINTEWNRLKYYQVVSYNSSARHSKIKIILFNHQQQDFMFISFFLLEKSFLPLLSGIYVLSINKKIFRGHEIYAGACCDNYFIVLFKSINFIWEQVRDQDFLQVDILQKRQLKSFKKMAFPT